MLTAKIIPKPPAPIEPKYPCLKQHRETVIVVLFSAPDAGTVVAGGGSGRGVGSHSESWAEESFAPFNATVALSN